MHPPGAFEGNSKAVRVQSLEQFEFQVSTFAAVQIRTDGWPDCANSGRSPTALRTGEFDPFLPFNIGAMNER
jgi:hypothetical protein